VGEGRKVGEAYLTSSNLTGSRWLGAAPNPPGPQEGRLREPSLQALLRELAAFNTGLCVITTRTPVADIADHERTSALRRDLEQLSSDAGAKLLRAMGVKGHETELRSANDEFRGHCLALTLLGSYLTDAYNGAIRCRSEVSGHLTDDLRQGVHVRKVMESYQTWLGEGPELAVLRMLGLFDGPADEKALEALLKSPPIPSLTGSLTDLRPTAWRTILARLRRASLLTLERQKTLGVVPQDTKLTPRPESLPAWDSLNADQKRLYARMMEIFAGFGAQIDYEMGRVIDAAAALPDADNTLIIYIIGDNGASAEGGLDGETNENASFNGVYETWQNALERIDELGGPKYYNHFPAAWAWAMDTPLQWTKQVASHFGGTRNPLIISWPAKITDKGGVRTQFHHVMDIMPTILEAAGIKAPDVLNGIPQIPIEGVSMLYTFNDARAPDRRKSQIFELVSNRAMYQDGWIASSIAFVPWEAFRKAYDPDKATLPYRPGLLAGR
jgi:hypothetical protein